MFTKILNNDTIRSVRYVYLCTHRGKIEIEIENLPLGEKMKRFFSASLKYFRNTDIFLLAIGLIASVYGIVLIASTTGSFGSSQCIIQIAATIIGIGLFVLLSLIDIDIFADKSKWIYVFCILFICTLIPWGVADDTGNKAWLRFGSVGIQPAEIVKVPYAIVLSKILVQS